MQESFKSGICGRIGGDEFIIYLAYANYDAIEKTIKEFKQNWQKNITTQHF